ncbi:extracellular calcium-sensing receptor-like [Lissotriton helveticus]
MPIEDFIDALEEADDKKYIKNLKNLVSDGVKEVIKKRPQADVVSYRQIKETLEARLNPVPNADYERWPAEGIDFPWLRMSLTSSLILLLISAVGEASIHPGCALHSETLEGVSRDGDIIIGGSFVVHSSFRFLQPSFQDVPERISCEGFQIRYYRDVLGMMFAIEEINRTPNMLPNMTLGFRVYDSCMSEARALMGTLRLLSGVESTVPGYDCWPHQSLAGIVGELVSALSLPMARMLGILHVPQISHGATLSALSDKLQFPSFLRTVPSNKFQNIALPQLIRSFQWFWVGMVVVDNDVGEQGGQAIRQGIETNGGCVMFVAKIHLSYTKNKVLQVVEVIKQHSIEVIVIHSPEVHVTALMNALYEHHVTGKVFVASASFGITPGLFTRQAWELLNGTVGLIPNTGQMPGFWDFLSHLHPSTSLGETFIKLFWEKAFICKWVQSQGNFTAPGDFSPDARPCSGKETLEKVARDLFELNDLSYTQHAYLAVHVYATALNELILCKPGNGPFVNGTCANSSDIQPWQVLHYVKSVNFTTNTGENVSFDENGDLSAAYSIINVQVKNNTFGFINVGSFDNMAPEGQKVVVNAGAIVWNTRDSQVPRAICTEHCQPGYRKAPREGQPVCCYDCLPCSLGEIANESDAAECQRCPDDQWPNERRDMCVPRVIEFLSYEEPLGLVLAITATFLTLLTTAILCTFLWYRETPIVRANNRGLSFLLLLALMLCFLCSMVFIGQPTSLSCMVRQTLFGVVFSVSISSVLAKTILVVMAFKATSHHSPWRRWLGPNTANGVVCLCSVLQVIICTVWILKSPPFPEMNTEANEGRIIFQCNEGHSFFFYCMMGYMALLALVSFIVAFLARTLPASFNETKLITFSMLVFLSVWLSFIPAYTSTRGKYMVAVEVFTIQSSSAGLLGCIFFPKCFIILLKPKLNSREHLKEKATMAIK